MKSTVKYLILGLFLGLQCTDTLAVLRSASVMRREVTSANGEKSNCYIWCFGDHHVDHDADLIQREELLECAQKMRAQIICEDMSDSSGIAHLGVKLPEFILNEAGKHFGICSPMFLTQEASKRKISVRNVEFRQCMNFRDILSICYEAQIVNALYGILSDTATNLNMRFPGLLNKICFGHENFKYALEFMDKLKDEHVKYSSEKLAHDFLFYCMSKNGFKLQGFMGKRKSRPRIATIFDKYISTLIEARILHTIRNDGYSHKHIFVVCGDNHLTYSTRVENGQEIVHYGVAQALQDMGWEKIYEDRSFERVIQVKDCCMNFIPS